MKVAKRSNFIGMKDKTEEDKEKSIQYISNLDSDVRNLVILSQGRIRFGDGTDGYRGENIAGEFQSFTTSATPDNENTILHTIGSIPVGYIVLTQNKAASLYLGTTAWTSARVYLKCNVASTAFKIFLLK